MLLARSDFVFLETPELTFTKGKGGQRWDITSSSKPLWVSSGEAEITRYISPYKTGDPPKIVLHTIDKIPFIDYIHEKCFEYMQKTFTDTIMSGKMMTFGTITNMINKCKEDKTSPNSITCALSENECTYFDVDGTLLSNPYPLHEGTSYRFAIQPTSLWYYNDAVGIKWYIRQIRKIEKDENEEDVNEMSDWSL